MENAKKYLLDIGFDYSQMPELFNDDDKSYYTIPELMESYYQSKFNSMVLSSHVSVSADIPEVQYKCVNCGDFTSEKMLIGNCSRECLQKWLDKNAVAKHSG